MTNKTKVRILSVAAAGAVFALLGIDNTLTLAEYAVRSDKIQKPVKLVFLSDIHSQKFKDGGKKIFDMIEKVNPDCVLLGGDVFDKYSTEKEIAFTLEFVKNLTAKFENCLFVSGNHEVDSKRGIDYRSFLNESGLEFFDGKSRVITAKSGQKILAGGVDFVHCDNGIPENDEGLRTKKELIERAEKENLFSILLRHVPMRTDGDEKINLILSGHNHGGLWRFPNTNAGVAGGGKKILPRFVHGEYKNGGSTMIVGSGITTDTYFLPRLYNVPEIVSVTLLPETNLPY